VNDLDHFDSIRSRQIEHDETGDGEASQIAGEFETRRTDLCVLRVEMNPIIDRGDKAVCYIVALRRIGSVRPNTM
jgi:hypothetical protein